jgi:uncharacterized protein
MRSRAERYKLSGSAFRVLAGMGRHHMLREQHFIESASNDTVESELIVTDYEAEPLLALIHQVKIRLFMPVSRRALG